MAGYRDPLAPKITGREYAPRHGGISVLCQWWSHTCLPSVCPSFVGDQPWARWRSDCIIDVHFSCQVFVCQKFFYYYCYSYIHIRLRLQWLFCWSIGCPVWLSCLVVCRLLFLSH